MLGDSDQKLNPPKPWDDIVAIESQELNFYHSLALYKNGTVKAWGPILRSQGSTVEGAPRGAISKRRRANRRFQ